MKHHHINIIGLLIAVFLMSNTVISQGFIGFPDGYLTTYDVFMKSKFNPIFIGCNALFALLFTYLFFQKKKPYTLAIGYILVLAIAYFIAGYFSLHLENGQGG